MYNRCVLVTRTLHLNKLQTSIPYFLDFFLRVLLISVRARTRVQFKGRNKTRAGSISLGSACSLEC